MGREVLVAEREPLGLGTVGRELALHGGRLLGASPALFFVDGLPERIEECVDIRADAQSEDREIVAGVADDGEFGSAQGCVGVEVVTQAAQEPGPAHPAGKGGNAHGVSQAHRPPTGARRPQGL